jgi:hypothetical protein
VDPDAAGLIDHVPRPADIADDQRQAVRHGLEHHVATRLAVAGEDKGIRRLVQAGDLLPWQPAVERHPAGQLEIGGERLACRPVESVADHVQRDRQVVHQAERADGVPCALGAHEPADEQQPHRLAGPPGPVDRRRELVDPGLAHHLESLHRHGGQEVLHVGGDPEHAARLLVSAAEQRITPDA